MAKISLTKPALQVRKADYDNDKTYQSVFNLARDIRTGLRDIAAVVNSIFDYGPELPSYTVATLPTASDYEAHMIYVSDETGGATVAFSDGTNWRRVQDRAVVS